MSITSFPKRLPCIIHHEALVTNWCGLRKRSFAYLEIPRRWVQLHKYPIYYADDKLAALLDYALSRELHK